MSTLRARGAISGVARNVWRVCGCRISACGRRQIRLSNLSQQGLEPAHGLVERLSACNARELDGTQLISLILVVLVFLVNVLAIRVAIFTNDVCEGAGRIFIALMFLSLLTSAIMYVHPTWLPAASCQLPSLPDARVPWLRGSAYSAKVGYHLGYVLAAAEYLPTEFNVDASA